jgi:translation initiation factor IF-3
VESAPCLLIFLRRCFNISDGIRINDEIRAKEIRVIDDEGNQLGIMAVKKAMELALEKKLDLVEISPNAEPPVCRVMDYGKFKYEKGKKDKEAKKKQKVVIVKEVKVKPRIDTHDFDVKVDMIKKFLEKEYKIKVMIMMFGRERSHSELGIAVLEKMAEVFEGTAVVEKKYGMNEGGQQFIMISPKTNK